MKAAHINDPTHFIVESRIDSRGRTRHVYACTTCDAAVISFSAIDAYTQMDEHYLTIHPEVLQ